MEIIKTGQILPPSETLILTIGNFDGVHLGHQKILARGKKLALQGKGQSVALTFKNHPSEVLRPENSLFAISTTEHKLRLIEEASIDYLLLLTFDKSFSEQTAEEFLEEIRNQIPFTYLILGHDATIGKNRQGTPEKICELAKKLHFSVEYIQEMKIQNTRISSSRIRQLIQEGKLVEASHFLGRTYSIYGPVIKGMGKGKSIGHPTVNIDVSHLCLPPLGVYAIKLLYEGIIYPGVANLGVAPTVRQDLTPRLEAYLFDLDQELYGKFVEIIFFNYIRPEKRFNTLEDLKEQIAKDVQAAKHSLKLD